MIAVFKERRNSGVLSCGNLLGSGARMKRPKVHGWFVHTTTILAALAIVACGSRLEGTYESDDSPPIAVEFKPGNKANLKVPEMPTVEVDFEISGKEVKIKTPLEGTIVGAIEDDGCLVFSGRYGTICKLESGHAPRSLGYLKAMKSDLQNVLTAQYAYFSHNDSYAVSMSALRTAFKGSPGVTITLGGVSSTGWTATATHDSTSRTCVLSLRKPVGSFSEVHPPICK